MKRTNHSYDEPSTRPDHNEVAKLCAMSLPVLKMRVHVILHDSIFVMLIPEGDL